METGNLISQLHIGSALLALILAAVVLIASKGTRFHKRMGYFFTISLVLVNGSAALMYNLTGRFNLLHVFVMISLGSLIYGMIPAIRRKPVNWLRRHISGMTGAALGVWAAGLAELTIRVLPGFLNPTQIMGIAAGIGVVFFFLIGFLIGRFIKALPDTP
ncbi:hypothetical protein [Robiginitalea sp.]|uniref:hypothetical protein n=1 Tax=Robiginitalea sp. TaxID=1902411 RepID=UPI003C71172E